MPAYLNPADVQAQSRRCSVWVDFSRSQYKALYNTMVELEEALWPEWFVFYHSYNSHPLLYEVYAALARIAYGRELSTPLPRVLTEGFRRYPTLQSLMDNWPGNDHHPDAKKVLISVQPSLFSSLECQPLAHFPTGYCSVPPFSDMKGVEEVLKSCGCDKKVVQEVQSLWKRYYNVTKIGERWFTTGHMLQIFVHKSVVDEVAYPSKEYGRIAHEHMPISRFLTGVIPATVQARLFVDPLYFVDTTKVRMHYYCAEASFRRGEFATILFQLLSSHLRPTSVTSLVPAIVYDDETQQWVRAKKANETPPRSRARFRGLSHSPGKVRGPHNHHHHPVRSAIDGIRAITHRRSPEEKAKSSPARGSS